MAKHAWTKVQKWDTSMHVEFTFALLVGQRQWKRSIHCFNNCHKLCAWYIERNCMYTCVGNTRVHFAASLLLYQLRHEEQFQPIDIGHLITGFTHSHTRATNITSIKSPQTPLEAVVFIQILIAPAFNVMTRYCYDAQDNEIINITGVTELNPFGCWMLDVGIAVWVDII